MTYSLSIVIKTVERVLVPRPWWALFSRDSLADREAYQQINLTGITADQYDWLISSLTKLPEAGELIQGLVIRPGEEQISVDWKLETMPDISEIAAAIKAAL